MDSTRSGAPDQIIATAQQLRKTRDASLRFLMLWAMTTGPGDAEVSANVDDDPDLFLRTLKKSGQFDWSTLYCASDCDD